LHERSDAREGVFLTVVGPGRKQRFAPLLAGVALAAVGMLSSASSAAGAVTIGQTPLSTPPAGCTSQLDLVQPTVNSATRYVVPSTIAQGTITSWSHRAAAGSGQTMTMKVFRSLGGSSYQVTAHDGPRNLTPSSLNTISKLSIPVRAGDILGANSAGAATVPNGCVFPATGDHHFEAPGDLSDGAFADFTSVPDTRVNVSARVEPVNTFTFGSVFRRKKHGTALVQVNVPNPGKLSIGGSGVTDFVHGSITIGAPGTVNVVIGATGGKRRKLRRRGRVFVVPSFRYTPTSGSRHSENLVVKLKKKRKKHKKR
jgi:hypothetical protein